MISETTEKNFTNKKFWIKFHEHTGAVKGISKQKPKNITPGMLAIETDDPDAALLLKGKANIKDFSVLPNLITDGWLFSRKSKELELQPVRKKFEQVPHSDNIEENDVYITFYKQSMKAVIAVNKNRIVKSNNLAMISDVVSNEYSLLNLFICKRNDPDSLISIINIDAKILIRYNKLIVNLPNSLLEVADIDQLSVFVLPVFDKYGINFVNKMIETPELKGESKLINHNVVDQVGLINITTVNDDTINITHNIEESQFNLFGSKNLLKFVVCDKHYDNLIGGFEIDVNQLLSTNSIDIKLNFNVPKVPLFLYKNNNILVSYNGDKHEQYD